MSSPKTSPARGSADASDLFQLLRDGQPRTRAELSALTGLARSTIGSRLDVLLELDLISPLGDSLSSGGRPPSRYVLNSSARAVVGVELGANHATVALTDLGGNIVASRRSVQPVSDGPEAVLSEFATVTHELLIETGRTPTDLLAVGMGLPGPVEHSTGRPVNPPIMPGWDGFDVPGWIFDSFGVNAVVDNDVNVSAIGEQTRAFADIRDLLYVKVATGIGAGIISGGVLQRGAQGSAGDIGHVRIERGDGVACHCGNFGCLEALASGPAVARLLRESGCAVETMSDVVGLVRRNDLAAIRAVRQAGRDIGEVLATCVSLVNPSVIVIGGSVSLTGEHLLAGVREVVYQRSTPLATQHLSIQRSRTGESAAVLGASMLALHHSLAPQSIETMTRELRHSANI